MRTYDLEDLLFGRKYIILQGFIRVLAHFGVQSLCVRTQKELPAHTKEIAPDARTKKIDSVKVAHLRCALTGH